MALLRMVLMATMYRPPYALVNKNFVPPIRLIERNFTVFLAGTIEMGESPDWQKEIFGRLNHLDINVLNPRRVVYDPKSIEEQIEWELDAMEMADMIIMHLEPNCKAPVSMLEFGLYAKSEKLVVHCPDGFWRRDNILITARRYGTKMVDTFDGLIYQVGETYNKWINDPNRGKFITP